MQKIWSDNSCNKTITTIFLPYDKQHKRQHKSQHKPASPDLVGQLRNATYFWPDKLNLSVVRVQK